MHKSTKLQLQEICQEQSKKIDEAVKAVRANIVAPRDEIQYELMEVVYEWAMGKASFESGILKNSMILINS